MDAGARFAHYTIVRSLGRGGMGEVYVAHDAKLNRQVAFKVLPPETAADAERLERFRREAQAVAALNHPNIVTIHSVEEADGVHFITLELVEGRTLDQLIPAGGVPIDTFFRMAVPLVDAVAAAHERGIIHRDLKPANVMVTNDGRVKVLDFGLAKLQEPRADAAADTATVGRHLTGEGRILGTVAYMSPEQAEAKPLDHRTDIFSLGVVLYQLATGDMPFQGETQMSILSSIIRDTPAPVTGVRPQLPRHLGRIIHKALEKVVTRRYQTALDLRNDLDELKHEIDTGEIVVSGTSISDPEMRAAPGSTSTSRRSWMLPVVGIAVVVAALTVGAWWMGWLGRPAASGPLVSGVKQLTTTNTDYLPSLSPDGQWIVFTRIKPGTADIFLQSIGDQTAVQLGKGLGLVATPAFSPDGATIAFARLDGAGIYVMGRMGGNVRRLTENGFNPAWSPDGKKIAFGSELVFGNPYFRGRPNLELQVVDVATGERRATGIKDAVQPAWSPHGLRFAYWGTDQQAWRDIYTAPIDGGAPVRITNDVHVDYSPVWSPDGKWLYFASTRGGKMGLWRVGIDERSGHATGEPEPLTLGGLSEPGMLSMSADGRHLLYQEMFVQSRIDAADFDPATLRLNATRQAVVEGSRRLVQLDVSPDGQWLAYRSEDARQDIYIARVDGTEQRQITNDEAKDWVPRWSPDSKRLTFYSNASGRYNIWVINRDGSGRMRLSDATGGSTYDPVWSPDGSEIIYIESGVDTFIVKSTVPFDKQTPRVVPRFKGPNGETRFRANDWRADGTIAGDGVILYRPATNTFESFIKSVFVTNPRWMRDGRQVYLRRDNAWFALDMTTRTERKFELPPDLRDLTDLVLSADSRRAFLLSQQVSGDIWQLDIR